MRPPKTRSLRAALVLASASAAALAAASSAQASSFAIRAGQSAEGLGLSFAGAASGGIGMGAMAWNPAAIALFPGRNTQVNATYILPRASYTVTDPATLGQAAFFGVNPNSGNIGLNGAFVPASYSNFQIADGVFFGWTTGAPWGLSSKPENQNYAGQIYGRSSVIRTLNFSPTFGFRVNPQLSLGFALQVQRLSTHLTQATGPAFGAPSSALDGEDTALGFRVGAVFEPWAGGTIGVGYRSQIVHNLEGTFETPVALGLLPAGRYGISAKLTLPDSVTVGFSQTIGDRWTVHLGGEWTNWSVFDRIPVRLANGAQITSLNFEYRDSWFVSAGAEYAWNDRLTLRGGVAYEWSAVTDRVRTVRISDNDRLWVSIGAGYQFSDQLRLDASYAHLFVKDAPIDISATSGNPNFAGVTYRAVAEPSIDVVSVSLTYRWDRPASPAAAAGGVFKP